MFFTSFYVLNCRIDYVLIRVLLSYEPKLLRLYSRVFFHTKITNPKQMQRFINTRARTEILVK